LFFEKDIIRIEDGMKAIKTIYFVNGYAELAFTNNDKGQYVINNINWFHNFLPCLVEHSQLEKKHKLEGTNEETKKYIKFFDFFLRKKKLIMFYVGRTGLQFSVKRLNDKGQEAFRMLYDIGFIVHESLDLKSISGNVFYSKCILDPFVVKMIRKDTSLPLIEDLIEELDKILCF